MTYLIEPPSLMSLLGDPRVRVIDCRTHDAYASAHIPGSAYISRDYWLKEPDEDGGPRGVQLLPLEELEALFGKLGIDDTSEVVLYDENRGRGAARVWWVLRYLGHRRAVVLNGGWPAWLDIGGQTESATATSPGSTFKSKPDPSRIASLADVEQALQDNVAQVVDTRGDLEWSGEDLHGNLRGGHVPGALHVEWSRLVTADRPWKFLATGALHRELCGAGIDLSRPVITYCQGGVRAAHVALALELAGCDRVRVYDGSMSEWGNRPDTELEPTQ